VEHNKPTYVPQILLCCHIVLSYNLRIDVSMAVVNDVEFEEVLSSLPDLKTLKLHIVEDAFEGRQVMLVVSDIEIVIQLDQKFFSVSV